MDKSLIPLTENFVDYIEIRGRNVLAPTGPNTRVALYKLRQEGFTFTHNVFSDKRFIGGVAMSTDAGGQVTDETVTAIRTIIKKRWGFYPPPQETLLQIYLVCREHSFNPVQDYLNSLTWDGVPRIDNMLRDYFKAPDTDFVRGVSRIVMIASVRRVFEPGCKFDYMTVLESGEGKDKSGGLEILYGIEYFSDQSILGLDDKHLAETIQGRWCIESADLDGMKKAEVAKIKAQLSRNTDRTRPAYGRVVIDRPRSCVFWGTTNEQDYLRSQTGNRRFFPVTVGGRIDVKGLARDRDQLWAEAMVANSAVDFLGDRESIMLPERLWKVAAEEQLARTKTDPWEDRLRELDQSWPTGVNTSHEIAQRKEGVIERVSSSYVFDHLGIQVADRNADLASRLRLVMKKLGWSYGHIPISIGGRVQRGYWRKLEAWELPAAAE